MKNETTLTRVDLCQGHPEVRGRQDISNWQLIAEKVCRSLSRNKSVTTQYLECNSLQTLF